MKRSLLRVASRLVILTALLAAFGVEASRARYYNYFDAFYACDNSYFSTLGDCRSNPGYPYTPTEGQCRYNAGNTYVTCLNNIWEPMPQIDFCAQARAARDSCNLNYGFSSGLEDWDAYMECRAASGIDQCE